MGCIYETLLLPPFQPQLKYKALLDTHTSYTRSSGSVNLHNPRFESEPSD